jgi:cell division septal protein FtsQ
MAKTSARTRRRRFFGVMLLLMVGLLFGCYFVMKYQLFSLKTVVIRDTNFQEKEPLMAAMSSKKGQNILWLSWVTGSHFLTKQFPKLESIRLSVNLPDTLTLRVKEKQPWLAFLGEKGSIVIAKDGTVLSDGSQPIHLPEKGNLLIIRGLPQALFDHEQLSDVVLFKLRTIVDKVRYHFPDAALQMDCTNLDFSSEFEGLDDIVLIRDDTLPVKLGSLVNLEEKLGLLKKFFWYYSKEENPKPLEYIDLRAKGKVIVKYAENG